MLKIAVSVNPNKDKDLAYTRALLDILEKHGCKVYMSDTFKKSFNSVPPVADMFLSGRDIEFIPEYLMFRKADICFVFGGDGTILKIAKKAAAGNAYILGINLGKVGYIAELEASEISLIEKIASLNSISELESLEGVVIDKRMMLKAEIIKNNEVTYSALALNDVVVSKGAVSRMAGLKLICNGNVISSYRADGIIVSTPTGSTAYCMSAGGPIIDPNLDCICAVPVCPYMCLNPGPIVFSADSVIEIQFEADKINEAFCTIDGKSVKSLANGDKVRILKSSLFTKLIRIKNINFYTLLNKKLACQNNDEN